MSLFFILPFPMTIMTVANFILVLQIVPSSNSNGITLNVRLLGMIIALEIKRNQKEVTGRGSLVQHLVEHVITKMILPMALQKKQNFMFLISNEETVRLVEFENDCNTSILENVIMSG